jgi:alpha-glucosidase
MWWRDGLIYQVYVRSFADSDGDGHGDLAGLRSKLDYLEWLGVDGVWLTPVHPSPNEDWGYDVADFYDVHPDYGTLGDLDELVGDAHARGVRILLDLVPNHTSDRHPWFQDPRKREWYVWAERPNNWRSTFGGPAWTLHEQAGKYYLHNFLPQQPDLNWWSEEVRDEFDRILRFWFDRGIDGFRIDVAHALVKDRELRDNPRRTSGDIRKERVYNMNRPEVHDVYKRWRKLADAFDPPRIFIGETWVSDVDELARYYGADDQLHMAMNFPFTLAPLRATALRGVVERTERAYPREAWPVWTGSNHDIVRFPTRWCAGDEAKIRCALLILLTLRGTPILYYGDELGMEQVEIPREEQLDRAHSRDGARTPMPWRRRPEQEWWLRHGDTTRNVEEMRADDRSTLAFTRALVELRRRTPELRRGAYATVSGGPGVWAWRRGEGAAVAVNLSERPRLVRGLTGTVRLDTGLARAGETASGSLRLGAWEGAVLTAD